MLILTLYIWAVYMDGIYGEPPDGLEGGFPTLMALGIVYPFLYDTV